MPGRTVWLASLSHPKATVPVAVLQVPPASTPTPHTVMEHHEETRRRCSSQRDREV